MRLNRECTRKIYDQRAYFYDSIIRILSLGRDTAYRRRIISHLSLQKGDNVLDFGCGTGVNFRYIEREIGLKGLIVGCDYSFGMLKAAYLNNKELNSKLLLCQMNDLYSCFSKGFKFDKILSTYTLSTLENRLGIIDMLGGMLKPGGTMVISDDLLPPGWFLGPRHMFQGVLHYNNMWYDTLIDKLRQDFHLLSVKFTHFGLIYICTVVKE